MKDMMEHKEYKRWSKSTEENGYCKKIKVEELENGFLVCLEEYGEKDGKYIDKMKKFFSTTNPLDGMTPENVSGEEELKKAIKNFLNE